MIREIHDTYPEGQMISQIRGQITDVKPVFDYKNKRGEAKKGQNLSIKDATGFISLVIFGGDELHEEDIGKTIECNAKEDGSFAPKVGIDKYTKRKSVSVTGLWRSSSITGETDTTLLQEFQTRRETREAKKAAFSGNGGGGGNASFIGRLSFKVGLDHFTRLYAGVRKNFPELTGEALVQAVAVLFNGVAPSVEAATAEESVGRGEVSNMKPPQPQGSIVEPMRTSGVQDVMIDTATPDHRPPLKKIDRATLAGADPRPPEVAQTDSRPPEVLNTLAESDNNEPVSVTTESW